MQYQYLVDRYSQSLTKYDTQELFERLKKKKGNITAATREVEIQRKTVYDWDSKSEDIKASTKRKILEASLKNDLYGTMDFLVKKNSTNYHEILERYISLNCDRIIGTNGPQEFQERMWRLEKFIKSHTGAVHDIKTIPIEEMIFSINQKARSLGVEGIANDINLYSPQKLSQKFIHLLETFDNKTMFKDEIAVKLGLPMEFVERACKAITYINPPTEADPETMKTAVRNISKLDLQEVGLKEYSLEYYHAQKNYGESDV